MAINSQIAKDQWPDFFVSFTNGNRGRVVSVEVLSGDAGSSGQAVQGKLLAVDYDPAGKGDDIVLTTGTNEIDYSHTIHAPLEVWRAQGDDGAIRALKIIDQSASKTILSLA